MSKNHFFLFLLLLGIFLTGHHKLVTWDHVWYSTNQQWYECHGKLGILFSFTAFCGIFVRFLEKQLKTYSQRLNKDRTIV